MPAKVMIQYVSILSSILGFVCMIWSFPKLVRNKHYWPWDYLEFVVHEPNKSREGDRNLKQSEVK